MYIEIDLPAICGLIIIVFICSYIIIYYFSHIHCHEGFVIFLVPEYTLIARNIAIT